MLAKRTLKILAVCNQCRMRMILSNVVQALACSQTQLDLHTDNHAMTIFHGAHQRQYAYNYLYFVAEKTIIQSLANVAN